MTKHQLDKILTIEEHIFCSLVDQISLGICYVVHRSIKFTIQDMHLEDNYEDANEDETSSKFMSIFSNKNLLNNVFYSNSLKNSFLAEDQFDIKNYQCICLSCKRNISASRFAPHLEKCLGMGRNSSRIASKKIKHSLYLEDTNINDDNYENNFYFNSQDFENSSSSSISNSGDRFKTKKGLRKKKTIVETTNNNLHIINKEHNHAKLDLDANQTIFEKETEKLVYFPSFKQSSILTQSLVGSPSSQKDFVIKNIFDIQVGDYVALNLKYIINHINLSNSSPSLSYLNFIKIFDMPGPDDIFSYYSNLEFINHVNQFTLYSSRWLGLIEKLKTNDLNEKNICVRWIKLATKECTSINQHLFWAPEDTLSTDSILSPSFPFPNVYFPNVIPNFNAIGALFNFDISKPMPAKLLHLLKYMSLAPQRCA